MTHSHSDALVFFGATGDLAYKKIFPALLAMVKRGKKVPRAKHRLQIRIVAGMAIARSERRLESGEVGLNFGCMMYRNQAPSIVPSGGTRGRSRDPPG